MLIDLRKAFNSVDRRLTTYYDLFQVTTLDGYKILTLTSSDLIFHSNLNIRLFCIYLGGEFSSYYPDNHGIPQGSTLVNFLCTMLINALTDAIDLPFLLYADDLVFYISNTDPTQILASLAKTIARIGAQ